MSSHSTSLEPKSQLTINLGKKTKEKEKFPIKDRKKTKEKEKFPIEDRKKTKEIYRKVFGPDNI